jgi:tripeptidyl-peptidase-1
MKSTLFAAVLAAFIAIGDAAPTPATYALHEKRSSSPRLWVRGERVDGDAILPIQIGLAQNKLEDAHIHLVDAQVVCGL